TGNFEQSITLFASIDTIEDEEALLMGGVNYEKTNQPQEAYSYWLATLSKFEETAEHQTVLLKIYRLEQQLQNYAAANETWSKIDHQNNPDLMFEQVTVLQNLDKTQAAL